MTKGDTMVEHKLDTEGADPLMLAGVNDRNMHEVSKLFSVRVVLRGNHLVLTADHNAADNDAADNNAADQNATENNPANRASGGH